MRDDRDVLARLRRVLLLVDVLRDVADALHRVRQRAVARVVRQRVLEQVREEQHVARDALDRRDEQRLERRGDPGAADLVHEGAEPRVLLAARAEGGGRAEGGRRAGESEDERCDSFRPKWAQQLCSSYLRLEMVESAV